MSGQMKYRLPVSSPQFPHMQHYIEAIRTSKEIQDNRGFYHFAGLHGAPGRWCWHHQFSRRSNLTARVFLPWHRAYLHRLEQSLQDIQPDASIPWWDWTQVQGIPAAFSTPKIDGQDNPLFDSEIILNPPQVPQPIHLRTSRNPDTQMPVFSFPAADVNQDGRATLGELVDYLIDSVSAYEQFNDLLESVHDSIHGYVGESMADVTFAAYDPLFFSHHCMIDRIWALWQKKHGIENFPAGLKDVVLEPFGLTAGEVLNFQSLGYEYAMSLDDIPISGTGLERVG
ncbi:tyrosinase family protein [Photobacterium sp. GJ3]|uniref:tyrosinase family protein n=1 Tax=Photobacterium sp. GJ3 TaxID=2829502 RepID=UPI001B8C1176|nr:tyrosinase family protein [Photobacterium sp. GJ3]QUJ66658.1 tyrosinase family protein [Photobacterium sp. GJ3]